MVRKACLFLAAWLLLSFQSYALEGEAVPSSRAFDAYHAAWQQLLAEAGIDADFVQLARNRQRRNFAQGTILLDCCLEPIWAVSAAEKKVQLFTRPFIHTASYLIVKKEENGKTLNPRQLQNATIALVEGYQYSRVNKIGSIVYAPDIISSMRLVAAGKADATIATREEFLDIKQKQPELPIALGGIYNGFSLAARVHSSRPDLLQRLNAAIEKQEENLRRQIADKIVVSDLSNSAFGSTWRAILKEAGITPRYFKADRSVLRNAFEKGKLHLDCCSTPEWRQRPAELTIQFFSDPITSVADYLVFKSDKADRPKALEETYNLHLGIVLGHHHVDLDRFATISRFENYTSLLDALDAGAVDMVLMNSAEFNRYQRQGNRQIIMGVEYAAHRIMARIHKDYLPVYPLINGAIKRLKHSGELNHLMAAGIRAAD